MAVSPGDILGPYEIIEPIGKGGMGEVYKASDTRLGRDVAIKVSAERFSDRFNREARAIAALNHPNVCALYDVGPNYLVLELIEGPTLAERIRRGAIPLDVALAIAEQIADALDAAHQKGIVHRDLKPANIKVDENGNVKVLDFGLAKRAETVVADPENSPTMTTPTRAGMLMGTAAYMSPEQVRGMPVDKRSDIWAFGVVLYEMLTGKRLFDCATMSDTLASILKEEPDLTQAPERMQKLLASCLEKDSRKRLRDIGDVRFLLAPPPNSAAATTIASSRWWQGAAIVAGCATLVMASLYFTRKPLPPAETARFRLRLPDNVAFTSTGMITISPDGRHLAFSAAGAGKRPDIWIQDFDADAARELPDTITTPVVPPFFWSPDSRFVVFSGDLKLRKVDIEKGTTEDICDRPGPPVGGSWSQDGVIIFGSITKGLWRVAALGGTATPLTTLDETRQEKQHQLPQFLPDGKHFLYLATSARPENSGIFVGSLEDPPGRRGRTRVLATGFGAQYVASPQGGMGYLLFLLNNTLMAQPFDLSRMQLQGEAAPVIRHVGFVYQTPYFSATPLRLAIRLASSSEAYQLTWLEPDGKPGDKTSATGDITQPVISPDNTRVAYQKASGNNEVDLWILDLARDTSTRFTFGPDPASDPVWSPDGTELAYSSEHGGRWAIYRKPANGARDEEMLLKIPRHARPLDWSRDGRFLLYSASDTNRFLQEDMWVLPLQGERKPFPFAITRFDHSDGRFSPDGRFIAYVSDETGRPEVYVRTFTGETDSAESGKWRVSRDVGYAPHWRADGKELGYIQSGRLRPTKQMSVSVDLGKNFRAGNPTVLFDYPDIAEGETITSDLQRHLVVLPVQHETPQDFSVLLNWASALKK